MQAVLPDVGPGGSETQLSAASEAEVVTPPGQSCTKAAATQPCAALDPLVVAHVQRTAQHGRHDCRDSGSGMVARACSACGQPSPAQCLPAGMDGIGR